MKKKATLDDAPATPPAPGPAKIDDLIVATEATAADVNGYARDEMEPTAHYLVAGGRICRRRRTKDTTIIEPLCNFAAAVTEELVLDDGAETLRTFVLEGTLDTGAALGPARVPVPHFAGMTWVSEAWGLRAIVRAGLSTKDALREAIQVLSPAARTRHVFTHTGWRIHNGHWFYLHAGGAIGRPGCEVDLGSDLARYALPMIANDPAEAMRQSLALLRVAPPRVTVPLWAAMFRAPLTAALPIDGTLWLEGQTGSLKSTLAGLFLSHYGAFDRISLSGSWSSTANQLERRAFLLKDSVFVIDDYVPEGDRAREMELKAARLLRAQGNLAGRARLRADLTERPAFPPRGLIVATGEQHPPGQSLLARMLVVEVDRADVHLRLLSTAQAETPRLPHAMAGYLGWLAPQMPTLSTALPARFAEIRARATADGEHLRIPEGLAHLWIGLDCGVAYATHIGACTQEEAAAHRDEAWAALLDVGRAQGQLVEEERPTHRFLKLLLALLVQRRGDLLSREDTSGDDPRDLLGWLNDTALYLIPEVAWHAVARFCREAGGAFPVREDRLRENLVKEGLVTTDTGRRTATIRVGSRTRRVLQIDRTKAEKIVGEAFSVTAVTTVTGGG